MAEDNPKYNPTFKDEVEGVVIGEHNIIYNYYGYSKDVRVTPVESEETAAEEKLPCPYRGLFHFGPNDAEFFFGREVFVEELFQATQTRNFIPVLGASGSGKSSVVLAGLVPKLQQEGYWKFTHFRPGSDPFHALALALVPLYTPNLDETEQIAQTRKLAGYLNDKTIPLSDVFAKILQNHFNHRILLIADQFEEIYTRCSDHTIQDHFLDCLLASFQSSNSGASSSTVLVTTMRADFLANALAYGPFMKMLKKNIKLLGAMSREELTEVIEKPAEKLGVTFEPGLVELILKDVENRPGNLPLLEFALTELWKKRTEKQLALDAYKAIGQVEGALVNYADEKYENLTKKEKEQARRIFIQLVHPDKDTRRLANHAELGEENWNLITRKNGLADSRLVVTNDSNSSLVVTNLNNTEHETVEVAHEHETVEIVHEALIHNWDKLRDWMKQNQGFRVWQERLRVEISQWDDTKRDKGALLRGAALVLAEEWKKKHKDELSQPELKYIESSIHQRTESHRIQFAAVATIILVVVKVAIIFLIQRNNAIQNEIETMASLSEVYLSNNNQLEALRVGVKAGRQLNKMSSGLNGFVQTIIPASSWVETQTKTVATLHQAVSRTRELNRLENHIQRVNKVIFSPDGKLLASASHDKRVNLWNHEGALVNSRLEHLHYVTGVSFSPNGKLLASASADGMLKLWRVEEVMKNLTPSPLITWSGHEKDKWITSVSFSSDNKTLISASQDRTVKLWHLDNEMDTEPRLLQTLKTDNGWVNDASFSPDGKLFALASENGTIDLWNYSTAHTEERFWKTLEARGERITSIAFSSDSHTLASAGGNNRIKLWNLVDGTSKDTDTDEYKVHRAQVNDVHFSPDGQVLASVSDDGTVKLWNKDGEFLETIRGHEREITSVSFNSDGRLLASASNDNTIRLWQINNLQNQDKIISSFSFTPEGKIFASADIDGEIELRKWDRISFGSPFKILNADDIISSLSFSSDGKLLASARSDQTIQIWDVEHGRPLQTLPGHADVALGTVKVSFHPDGKILVSAINTDKTIKLWDVAKDTPIKTLSGHAKGVTSVSFSPDGQIIATASDDGTLKLWSFDCKLLHILEGHEAPITSFSFSADSKILASASRDNTIKLWQLGNRELLTTLKGHNRQVTSISFSPDGKILVSAGADRTIKLWSVTDGTLLKTLRGRWRKIHSLSFSSDGKALIGASERAGFILLNLDLDSLLMRSCKRLQDYLNNNPKVKERQLCDAFLEQR